MSNIQITENASGKYPPEWFYSESQTPEWISFAHKADDLRENFINLFGIERLKSLSGKDLLTSLFYNDEGTKTNLCYRLEMDKDIREVFGSISGGAAYKFGLFYHKKNQSWTCGSPLKPMHHRSHGNLMIPRANCSLKCKLILCCLRETIYLLSTQNIIHI